MTVPTIYVDCSAMMRELIDEIGVPAGMNVCDGDPTPAELEALVADAVIVLNGHTRMDAALLAAAPHLRSVVFLGTGASSYIDMTEAQRSNIRVRPVRGYGDRTIAEHAFGLLLAAARDTVRMDRDVRTGRWAASEGIELHGKTLGLLGLGGVGSEMARIASGFGMRVVAWNRSGVPAGLDELLAMADAISLHLALVPETKGLLDAARLARMKPGALLINTARGALVDEPALIAALQRGHIAHAALDVFATEPLPARHPLTTLTNITLTSHAAWKSRAASRRLLQLGLDLVATDADRLRAGQPLKA
jgi:D-3-phosphoglycerate dehydrogenase / 2-oxoglutarate reductase